MSKDTYEQLDLLTAQVGDYRTIRQTPGAHSLPVFILWTFNVVQLILAILVTLHFRLTKVEVEPAPTGIVDALQKVADFWKNRATKWKKEGLGKFPEDDPGIDVTREIVQELEEIIENYREKQ